MKKIHALLTRSVHATMSHYQNVSWKSQHKKNVSLFQSLQLLWQEASIKYFSDNTSEKLNSSTGIKKMKFTACHQKSINNDCTINVDILWWIDEQSMVFQSGVQMLLKLHYKSSNSDWHKFLFVCMLIMLISVRSNL